MLQAKLAVILVEKVVIDVDCVVDEEQRSNLDQQGDMTTSNQATLLKVNCGPRSRYALPIVCHGVLFMDNPRGKVAH